MKLPSSIIHLLKEKKIYIPTGIQMQGIPVGLSGRDMIGIASTGSGKTLTFVIPIIMFALEQEIALRFKKGEGPYGLIIVPSRELAKQISDVIQWICDSLPNCDFPEIRVGLSIGGFPIKDQARVFERFVFYFKFFLIFYYFSSPPPTLHFPFLLPSFPFFSSCNWFIERIMVRIKL